MDSRKKHIPVLKTATRCRIYVAEMCGMLNFRKLLQKNLLFTTNDSGMTYNCPDAAFVIESRKTNKKSIGANEKFLYFRNSSGNLSCLAGKSTKVAYCFDNFTILKEQCLRIYVNEMGGQKELCIPVEYKDINRAQIWR